MKTGYEQKLSFVLEQFVEDKNLNCIENLQKGAHSQYETRPEVNMLQI